MKISTKNILQSALLELPIINAEISDTKELIAAYDEQGIFLSNTERMFLGICKIIPAPHNTLGEHSQEKYYKLALG